MHVGETETPREDVWQRSVPKPTLQLTSAVIAALPADLEFGFERGRRVLMLTAPAVVFLPNNVPCGPRNTSTCSRSTRSNCD